AFSGRVTLNTPKRILETKKAIKKAFLAQIYNLGFGFVEVLSPCPVNWKMTPVESMKYIDELTKTFPIGIFKDKVSEFLKNEKRK
ncbi:MAG: 2-oxoglutarate oxidoreductase, partial [Thermodesulfobacteriota bacterium]